MFKNTIKAILSAAVIPVSVVTDICVLPSTAYYNKHPFSNTKFLIDSAKNNIKKVIK